jgi:hypothetical protein
MDINNKQHNTNLSLFLIIHVAIELSVNHIGNNGKKKLKEETIVNFKNQFFFQS